MPILHQLFCTAAVLASLASAADSTAAGIIAMERAALDRWGTGDTLSILDLYAKDITYFDPGQDKRVDGLEAMRKLYGSFSGTFKILRFDMIDPKVQTKGDVAVLTYNLVDEVVQPPTAAKSTKTAWNVTSVYARIDGRWQIIHGHFSYVKGKLSAEAK